MHNFDFMLNFTPPHHGNSPESYLDALYEAGCSDAVVGVGFRGMIGLDFTRPAESAEEALRSAIRNVQTAIPGATLVQAGPDLVGLTDMADIFGFTRQNMRKYALSYGEGREAFPLPTILGEPSLWHLAEIASWLKMNTSVVQPADVLEISKAAAMINHEIDSVRLKRILALA
jgi:hypothetical protein